ncbi:hypothetical protein PRIPAC_88164, partial [Pristionchus pacificus]
SMVVCGECGSSLQAEPAIYAARRLWHEGHFRCRGCTRIIHEDEQYALVVDENACPHEETTNEPHSLCRKCFEHRSSVKCHGCNRGIVSTRYVEADGRMWHSYCFVCAFCQLEVVDSYVHDEDGRPLHKVCFLDRAMKAAIVDEGARLSI